MMLQDKKMPPVAGGFIPGTEHESFARSMTLIFLNKISKRFEIFKGFEPVVKHFTF